jgi:hypothetical protein
MLLKGAARGLCRKGIYEYSLTVDSLWSNSYHISKIWYAPGSYLGPEVEDLKINKIRCFTDFCSSSIFNV